jgi:hypothetical protein
MTARPDSFSEAKELSRLDDPIVLKRCVKLKRRSNFQAILLQMTMLLFVATFVLLVNGYGGSTSRSGRYHPPIPSLIPYGMTTLAISLTTLVSLFGCRNYYLLDPSQRRLYHHFRLFWWRRRRIVFRQGEIFGLTTEGRLQRSRRGSYWTYRLVAVGITGQQEPLSDWKRGGLEMCNARAVELAKQLGCQSIAAPPKSTLSVELKDGTPVLRFNPRS